MDENDAIAIEIKYGERCQSAKCVLFQPFYVVIAHIECAQLTEGVEVLRANWRNVVPRQIEHLDVRVELQRVIDLRYVVHRQVDVSGVGVQLDRYLLESDAEARDAQISVLAAGASGRAEALRQTQHV